MLNVLLMQEGKLFEHKKVYNTIKFAKLKKWASFQLISKVFFMLKVLVNHQKPNEKGATLKPIITVLITSVLTRPSV